MPHGMAALASRAVGMIHVSVPSWLHSGVGSRVQA